ncbi:hypothetical protein CU098_008332 [Rhizopus stolonifer]|uniref:Uncharacterized protein n=1 Tax=Rhizopus stolonifer TaxID=4846 RepID=A0A367KKE6_RHIST|nr:hypothetical protein CU098_008332 [Rhizopus stolonifer]
MIAMPCLGARRKSTSTVATLPKGTNSIRRESIASQQASKLAQIQQEYNNLKSQNMQHLDLITKQSSEIEQLKQELTTIKLSDKERQELLEKSQQRIQELESVQQEAVVSSLSVQDPIPLEELQSQLEEKDKVIDRQQAEFEKLKAQWEIERAELAKPALEQVSAQLEELKQTNKMAVERLNEKENELVELRAELSRKDRQPKQQFTATRDQEKRLNRLTMDLENDRLLVQKLEELNQQLEAQKQKHEAILESHAKVIAEKDKALLQHQKSLDQLKLAHENDTKTLEQEQMHNLKKLELKHQYAIDALTKRLKQAENQAKSHVNDELDKILVEFEQSQHSHSVELASLQQSHQEQLSVMKRDQQQEIKNLMTGEKVDSFFNQQNSVAPVPSLTNNVAKLKDNAKFNWPPVAV